MINQWEIFVDGAAYCGELVTDEEVTMLDIRGAAPKVIYGHSNLRSEIERICSRLKNGSLLAHEIIIRLHGLKLLGAPSVEPKETSADNASS